MAKKYCPKCRHIRKVTHNKKAKCLPCGLSILASKVIEMSDKQKLKAIKLEMSFK